MSPSLADAHGTAHPRTRYAELEARPVALRLVGGGLLLAVALSVVGWLIVTFATPSPWTRFEDDVNRWFFDHRTPTLNTVTHVGSSMAETVTCIALLAVVVITLRLWLSRWRESWAVFAAIVGELLVFLVVTAVVNRPRPTVPHLDAAPPTSSFPSGHVGAAVALYGCIAVVVHREMRNRLLAGLVVAVCCVIPVIVAVSRVYRGMHHLSDVVFGAVGGGLWLALVVSTLLVVDARRSTDAAVAEDTAPSTSLLR
jgi:membrane-associated phospholipid phosphatase